MEQPNERLAAESPAELICYFKQQVPWSKGEAAGPTDLQRQYTLGRVGIPVSAPDICTCSTV